MKNEIYYYMLISGFIVGISGVVQLFSDINLGSLYAVLGFSSCLTLLREKKKNDK